MRGKTTAWLCAAVLAVSAVLAGCSDKQSVVNYEEQQEEITTITFFGNKYEPENVTVIEEIISSFMRENPEIRVSYESLKGNGYYEALEKRMAAGKGDDVFMVNHDAVLSLQADGKLLNLSEMDTISDYTDQMLGQMEEDGKIYWVPTTVSVFGLYCNTDLLTEHGYKVPDNLNEWEEICDGFVEKGITPVIANNDISLKTLAIGRGFFKAYQEGRQEEVFEKLNDGTAQLSEYLTEGFTLAEEFIKKGYIDAAKALNTEKTSDDLLEFAKGESPFMLTGGWAAQRVSQMEPGFVFEVAPLPALEDGTFEVINADTRLSVNAEGEHTDAALKFVEFFTQKENIQKFADQQSSFSPLKGGGASSVMEVQPLIPCYQSGCTVIGADGHLDVKIWSITAEVSKKILSGDPVSAAMQWMDQQVDEERGTP